MPRFDRVGLAAKRWAMRAISPRRSRAASSISPGSPRQMMRPRWLTCWRSEGSGVGALKSIYYLPWGGRMSGRPRTSACRSRSPSNGGSGLARASSNYGAGARRGDPGVRSPRAVLAILFACPRTNGTPTAAGTLRLILNDIADFGTHPKLAQQQPAEQSCGHQRDKRGEATLLQNVDENL